MLPKILYYFNLTRDIEDFNKIHETIEKDIIFKGTNLWILGFAIIVASVGLNMNSTAVIIGAMLISPLMGPINGMGYSLATYNFQLFQKAVKNFTFAVAVSLLASTTYFLISPVSTAQSELLSRTTPTIYDVLIALFGGLAGIVAISSKHKGNVIPGVAIATALMPPLCTAGYGLANANMNYFFGALYLFTINTVFIAFSSVIISQILKFPIITIVDELQKKKINRWTTIIILITIVPSIYFGYGLVQKEKFVSNAKRYTNNISLYEGNYLLKYDVDPNNNSIKLVYGGSLLTPLQKETIKKKADDFDLTDLNLIIDQGLSFEELKTELNETETMKSEINRLAAIVDRKEEVIDSLKNKNIIGRQLLDEIKLLYPQIKSLSYGSADNFNGTDTKETTTFLMITTKTKNISSADKKKITEWLKTRLNNNNLKIFF